LQATQFFIEEQLLTARLAVGFDGRFIHGVFDDPAGHAGPWFDVAPGFLRIQRHAGTGRCEA